MPDPSTPADPWIVPLFPLPTVVLLPKAVLPLHIFERRYRTMVRTALQTDRQMAMAVFLQGWEQDYQGQPSIFPVVCVGTILSHQQLPDERFNILLQGHTRARVVHEIGHKPYRQALVEPLEDRQVDELELAEARSRLMTAFWSPGIAQTNLGTRIGVLLQGNLPTSDLVDLIAFSFVDSLEVKCMLLAEPDPRVRAKTVADSIDRLVRSRGQRGRHAPGLN